MGSPAGTITRFEHESVERRKRKRMGRCKTSSARTHNDHVIMRSKIGHSHPLKGERALKRLLAAQRLNLERGAHEIIETDKTQQAAQNFDNQADNGRQLEQTANRPARSPRHTNQFRAHQNGDTDDGDEIFDMKGLSVCQFNLRPLGQYPQRPLYYSERRRKKGA